ncbi:probable serine/threonine-protein kinase gcn2 [Phtheirospermum japonicum]|uniref:Probable serine/threonine-protein kinase gcn2 n=1 Tax=Phtheirospermum japonicum TaxID=374723 RepID=A0A830DEK2_9LAMI|nr:probable serine/threonine-protein kinase gcn2 [Phtheirospermum japonicum]
MGHNSKKKKKRGGGGRRAQSKDHHSFAADNSEILAEEITALCAIFQEDCNVVSESPPQIDIKLRPYSKDTGYEDSDVSVVLSVRCVQGYPYKCPKLQIVPEKGLSKSDANNLLSLLYDQANSNAREGRVMIYNLVEAAQEFLSEITPQGQSSSYQLSEKDATIPSGRIRSFSGPFVFSHVDLFSGSGELWQWNLDMEESSKILPSQTFDDLKLRKSDSGKQLDKNMKPSAVENIKAELIRNRSLRLGTLEEESEDETKSTDSSADESDGNGSIGYIKDIFVDATLSEADYGDSDSESKTSSEFASHDQATQTVERDLLLAHLLRVACAPKGPLGDALQEITSELVNIGILSEGVRDMAIKPSPSFDKAFDRVFRKQISSSKVSHFWKTASDFGVESSSIPSSRYLNDFEELQPLGHGGFGHVVLCKNKLDGRQYAVKKIRLKDKSLPVNDRILREVATLARLQHQHVVRYYQAWYETGLVDNLASTALGSRTSVTPSFSYKDTGSSDQFGHENMLESTYLYIQMEYCPRTLKQMFESYNHLDKELAWHLSRQIVEGLAHIHGQGIIHRDLTPNNIFFDARNDIKIGDFGLAKFLKLEQLDQDVDATETIGVSIDGTGQVGTYFYTAPEIEQGWPKINEKADMYSLGVVFFELWHPFDTAMERHVVLSDLKLKGVLPSGWVVEYPEQASVLQRLMSPSPSDRPSATELLKHAFPPRMESELLDNLLRTIHSSEDTSIYDKLVSAIFDEDTLSTKDNHENVGILKPVRGDTSSVLFTDVDTGNRDLVVDIAKEVYRQHCAKHLEIIPVKVIGDCQQVNRNTVKMLTQGGDMVEFCHELRFPFAKWIIAKQKSFFRRYEISYVYRRAIGHSPPNRYLQGDFDIVGGATALTEAEVIKATMDIISRFFHSESCDIHLNHGDLLEAIWSWTGIKSENRQKVAELLSLLGSLRPQSSERKSKWVLIRRQLRQELDLAEDAVNRLQTVGLRFCGTADQALPRLRGALPADKSTRKALDELSELFNYLRVWKIDRQVFLDALMPSTESYNRNLYFQIYFKKENNPVSLMEGTLLAVGGRYDHLLQQMADSEHKSSPPGAVGSSIALETIFLHSSIDSKFYRNDIGLNILVCSRGGGGLLVERMELVAELWDGNMKAEFVPLRDPSLTEQYEYASEHDIKYLVVITDTGVSQQGSVEVRHLDLKKAKEVERENLVKFLSEAMTTQFRNPSIWS